MDRRTGILLPLLVMALAVACTTPPKSGNESGSNVKISGEAYLFDARLWRDGKPTSFRLHIYQTDTLIGLGGRGYLGKGALKGWVSADSILVYFPSVDEYLYEDMAELISSFDCASPLVSFNVLGLFADLPDPVEWSGEGLTLQIEDSDEPTYILSPVDCDWTARLVYDDEDKGWRVEEFYFDDGHDTRLEATRRRYNDDADMDQARFEVEIPAEAVRIFP